MGTNINTELFTDKSKSYAKYRSGYPEELIIRVLEPFPNNELVTVADVGAGTGISSRLLADAGAEVIAVEPNKAMADAADKHQKISFVIAPAEKTTLETGSVDIVSSFQAFHWFQFRESLKEFNRILKPKGRLALVWSYWDETDPFTVKYLDIITKATNQNEKRVSPYDGFPSGFLKKWRIRFLWKFRTLPYFKKVERVRYSYEQQMNTESLIGCAHSQSYLVHEGELWENLCKDIEELVNDQNGGPTNLMYKVNLFIAEPKK
ncbi:MAG TPA: class I SAM-dependent methyltransferase [Gracilimonas sp.]|uniref:class I SAM-dependent methyltransferase n=1 Tax=Gracilimonas sp. TaxID=1974203 RepID=UPI002DA279FA|nr:class I SAM-dependent methyltransferase [Gracilimonas sp.]